MYLAVEYAMSQSLEMFLLVVEAEDRVAEKDASELLLRDRRHATGELLELQL